MADSRLTTPSPDSKPTIDQETFSIFFQEKIKIHPDVLSKLNKDTIYYNLHTRFHRLGTATDFWEIFKDWVNKNLPKEAEVEKPHTNPAILIFLAFHLPDEYNDNYAELTKDAVIKSEWDKACKQSDEKKVNTTKASGGLLNKAAEILLTLKFHGDNRYDFIIKNLLFYTAGSLVTPGASRPHTYFLLGELALHDGDLLLAFDYFIFYLKNLPSNSKIIFRLDTIKLHTDRWAERHPDQTHPFIEMIDTFEKEFLESHEETRQIIATGKLSEAKLYEELYKIMIARYNTQPATQMTKQNINQNWVPNQQISEAIAALNDPTFRQQMVLLSSQTNEHVIEMYRTLKKDCMLFFNKIRRVTVSHVNEAIIEGDAIQLNLAEKNKDPVLWTLDQLSISPVLTAATTILGWIKEKGGFNVSIFNLTQLKNVFNSMNGLIATTVNFRKRYQNRDKELEVERADKKRYAQAAIKYQEAANLLLHRQQDDNQEQAKALISEAGQLLTEAEQKQTKPAEKAEEKKDEKSMSISENGSNLYQFALATVSQPKDKKSNVLADFMEEYDHDQKTWSAWLTSWFRSYNLRTVATYKPDEKDIILHAMENPYRFWGLCGNRTAKILYRKYGIDVSKAHDPAQEQKLTPGLGSVYYGKFKEICTEDKAALDQFYADYADKLPKGCTPYRATHTKDKNKTLTGIIEETKNRSVFSYFVPYFFPSYKRTATVLESEGADLSQKSSEIRANLIKKIKGK